MRPFGKSRKAEADDYQRPETFKLCVLERMANRSYVMIDVLRMSEHGFPIHAGFLSIDEAYEIADQTELFLRDRFGGGHFRLRFSDEAGRILTWYSFRVAGPPKDDWIDNNSVERMLQTLMLVKELFQTDRRSDRLLADKITGAFKRSMQSSSHGAKRNAPALDNGVSLTEAAREHKSQQDAPGNPVLLPFRKPMIGFGLPKSWVAKAFLSPQKKE